MWGLFFLGLLIFQQYKPVFHTDFEHKSCKFISSEYTLLHCIIIAVVYCYPRLPAPYFLMLGLYDETLHEPLVAQPSFCICFLLQDCKDLEKRGGD
jgi:hypothetical protein